MNQIPERDRYSEEIARVREVVARLQEARHTADYDLASEIGLDEANELYVILQAALANPGLMSTHSALLLDDRWSRRG